MIKLGLKKFTLLLLVAYVCSFSVFANTTSREQQFVALTKNLRCLVCQNQSLYDSNTKVAVNLKQEIKLLLEQGQGKNAIANEMIARYGEFISYNPQINIINIWLWLIPLILVGVVVLVVARQIKC